MAKTSYDALNAYMKGTEKKLIGYLISKKY